MKYPTQKISPLLICILLLSGSCAVNPVTGKRNLMLMSEAQEIAIGKENDPVIVSMFGLYPNEDLQRFVNQKGQQMAKISHRPDLDYEFRVLDSPVVNAFALPGGYIYFTRGILAHFNNEAEFAGVLGHEIGHVTSRHSAQQYSRQLLFQVGFIAGLIISPEFAQFADVGQTALGLMFLKFGRDHETESDKLGVEYSTKIGYDARKMADFFQTINRIGEKSGASQLPTFLSTHPNPANRYNKVHAYAAEMQQTLDATNLQVNRNSYLQMIDGMIYGEDPRQGFVENNIFYHPELKFQYPIPTNWVTQNSNADVRMAPKDGKALMILTFAREATLDAAAQATVTENKLTVIESRKQQVNGFPALIMLGDLHSDQNPEQVIRVLTYFIQDGTLIYKFHGLTIQKDYQKYAPLFVNSMSGFRRLTDQDKLNRQPERLLVAAAPASGTLQTVFQTKKIPGSRMEEFAILNGMKLTDPVSAGTLIKVLR